MSAPAPTAESRALVLRDHRVELVPIASILVGERQRKVDISDKDFQRHIGELADSISRVGLIHPLTLADETNLLVAGYCRMIALIKLGHKEAPVLRRGQLSTLDLLVMELEENLQRKNLEWWESAQAISTIDELQRQIATEKGTTWSTKDTAAATNTSAGTVSQSKQVAEAIAANPSLKDVGGLVAALKAIKTEKKLEERKAAVGLREAGNLRTFPARIEVGDALALIRAQPDASFDAVVTNFPFGIELTIGKDQKEIYKDDEDYIVKLVRAVTRESYRVLKPDSWMVGFFDVRKITYSNKQREFVNSALFLIRELAKKYPHDGSGQMAEAISSVEELAWESLGLAHWMQEAGFDYVQLLPCIWGKPNKLQGMIGDPNKGFIMGYEAFVLAGKGEPILMKKGLPNLFLYDTLLAGEKVQEVQMPTNFCTDLVRMVCMGGAHVLDPFAGSGAIGLGALENQCSFLGFELDPKRAENGNLLLQEHLRAKPAKVAP